MAIDFLQSRTTTIWGLTCRPNPRIWIRSSSSARYCRKLLFGSTGGLTLFVGYSLSVYGKWVDVLLTGCDLNTGSPSFSTNRWLSSRKTSAPQTERYVGDKPFSSARRGLASGPVGRHWDRGADGASLGEATIDKRSLALGVVETWLLPDSFAMALTSPLSCKRVWDQFDCPI